MFNFKAFAVAATLAASTVFGGLTAAPANAGTCWFDNGRGTNTMSATYCKTNMRTNYNGHKVLDVVDHKGTEVTMVFWTDNVVEVIGVQARPIRAEWWTDRQGDIRIATPGNGFEMAIRF